MFYQIGRLTADDQAGFKTLNPSLICRESPGESPGACERIFNNDAMKACALNLTGDNAIEHFYS
jgi:hypothetical protein